MKRLFITLFGFLIIISCSKGGGDAPAPPVTPPVVVILEPGTPALISPANNEPCEDGTSINDTQSEVNFQWGTTDNTQNYVITITNLIDNSELTFNTSDANKVVALSKTEPYRWSVTAQGETGSTPAQSSLWKFYLAGDAQVNYAPFPPDLLSPKSGSNVFAVNNEVTLTWGASDVDNDLSTYKVYIDDVDGSTLLGSYSHTAETTSIAVSVSANTLYYWKVIAIDANENESDSGVYTFRVQ
ncbi:MAG: hypothetical protein P8L83_05500 [Flavobacteriaceae bacterium]|nr:hypothetical protein [Flavobacteriaceae bacterium]